jgi:hypothetical protein
MCSRSLAACCCTKVGAPSLRRTCLCRKDGIEQIHAVRGPGLLCIKMSPIRFGERRNLLFVVLLRHTPLRRHCQRAHGQRLTSNAPVETAPSGIIRLNPVSSAGAVPIGIYRFGGLIRSLVSNPRWMSVLPCYRQLRFDFGVIRFLNTCRIFCTDLAYHSEPQRRTFFHGTFKRIVTTGSYCPVWKRSAASVC